MFQNFLALWILLYVNYKMLHLLLLAGVFGGAFYYLANFTDFVAAMDMYLNLDDDEPEYS